VDGERRALEAKLRELDQKTLEVQQHAAQQEPMKR
jgi:hypothetical protein